MLLSGQTQMTFHMWNLSFAQLFACWHVCCPLLHNKALWWEDPHTPPAPSSTPAFHLEFFETHLVRDRGFSWAGRWITRRPTYATVGVVEFLTDGWVPAEFFVGAKWSPFIRPTKHTTGLLSLIRSHNLTHIKKILCSLQWVSQFKSLQTFFLPLKQIVK